MSEAPASPDAVLEFWFGTVLDDPAELERRNRTWFRADAAFDATVRERFAPVVEDAARGAYRRWKLTPRGTLALILVFDQFPRNIFRNLPGAFAFDDRAVALSRDGIAMGIDIELAVVERIFFYLPLMHAEDPEAQDRSLACYEQLHADAPATLKPLASLAVGEAREHRDIVHRFGRFPHRNLVLGRTSTRAEVAWIADHPGAYGQG